MRDLHYVLVMLHGKVEFNRADLFELLEEHVTKVPIGPIVYPGETIRIKKNIFLPEHAWPTPEHILLLYKNYISLSELSYSIKEYFLLKKIVIIGV